MGNWNLNGSARRKQSRSSANSQLAETCLQITDLGLIAILFVAPLFFGGRHPLGLFVFVCLTCATSLAWFARQTLVGHRGWVRTSAHFICAAAFGLVVFQLAPLPESWLNSLAPRLQALLPLWSVEDSSPIHLGSWKTLSLSPSDTTLALAALVSYTLLFTVVTQRLEKLRDIYRLLQRIAFAAVFMSSFGILQYFTANGRFFWFYEYPYATTLRVAKGSFTCGNHFAHFVVLGSGLLLGCIVWQMQRQQSTQNSLGVGHLGMCAGLVMAVLGVLWSGSRGGALSLAIIGSVSLLLYYLRGLISATFLTRCGLVSLLVVGFLSLHGYDEVTGELDDLLSGSIEQLDQNAGRRTIWSANLAAIADGGVLGSGAGTHRVVYPVYLDESIQVDYTHAENGYLQIGSENGFLGLTILAVAVITVGAWCLRSIRYSTSDKHMILSIAVCAALLANVVHSIIDFVWFIPACMTLTTLLSASALRLAQMAKPTHAGDTYVLPLSRLSWAGLSCGVVIASAWCITTTFGPGLAAVHWDQYQRSAISSRLAHREQLVSQHQDQASQQNRIAITRASIYHLRQVLEHNPRDFKAHQRLAKQYLKLFDQLSETSENAMTVEQIRDSVVDQNFSDSRQLFNWLKRAFPKNYKLLYAAHRHTSDSVRLCPMLGSGYIQLATLCFLEGKDTTAVDVYVAQAEKCRPQDSSLLYQVGRQYWLLGQRETAVNYWSKIFHSPGTHQMLIAKFMTHRLQAVAFIDFFSPDWRTLRFVWQQYHDLGWTNESLEIIRYARNRAIQSHRSNDPSQATQNWISLSVMQRKSADTEGCIESLRHAQSLSPNNYEVARQLGKQLLKSGRHESAIAYLRWCMLRQPTDEQLKLELAQAIRGDFVPSRTAARAIPAVQ